MKVKVKIKQFKCGTTEGDFTEGKLYSVNKIEDMIGSEGNEKPQREATYYILIDDNGIERGVPESEVIIVRQSAKESKILERFNPMQKTKNGNGFIYNTPPLEPDVTYSKSGFEKSEHKFNPLKEE